MWKKGDHLQRILRIAACPICRRPVELLNSNKPPGLFCRNCQSTYEIKENVPILLDEESKKGLETLCDTYYHYADRADSNRLTGFLRRILAPSLPVRYCEPIDEAGKANFHGPLKRFIDRQGERKIVVDMGCGRRRLADWIINFDIKTFPNVDMVGGIERLPFLDESVDAVIVQQVLHAVRRPERAIAEICRVLRPGGEIYFEDGFILPYIGQGDLFRWSVDGAEALCFNYFRKVEGGVSMGAGSTMGLVVWNFLTGYFLVKGKLLNRCLILLYYWFSSLFKHLDRFIKREGPLATLVYFIGSKR